MSLKPPNPSPLDDRLLLLRKLAPVDKGRRLKGHSSPVLTMLQKGDDTGRSVIPLITL